MKIVDKAVKKVYRFNCPNCQSRLEGESKEFEDIGGKISKFFCPVCKKDRAFESGVLLFIVGMFTVTNDLKNDRKNRSVSYRSYRKGD